MAASFICFRDIKPIVAFWMRSHLISQEGKLRGLIYPGFQDALGNFTWWTLQRQRCVFDLSDWGCTPIIIFSNNTASLISADKSQYSFYPPPLNLFSCKLSVNKLQGRAAVWCTLPGNSNTMFVHAIKVTPQWLCICTQCLVANKGPVKLRVFAGEVLVGAPSLCQCIIVQDSLVSSELPELDTRHHSKRTRVTTSRHIINLEVLVSDYSSPRGLGQLWSLPR